MVGKTSKRFARRVIFAYVVGVLALLIAANTPFYIPCLWKLAFGIASPACGLTRAFILASQFNLIEAAKMNILFLPLAVGMAIYFACALADAFFGKQAIKRFNCFFSQKWFIALAAVLAALSWYYNIVREI